jgi:C4-dicarboxylate-specific signal transduction histidine kinase
MSFLDTRTTMLLVAGLYVLLPIALLWAIAPHKKHFAWWWLGGSFSVALGLGFIGGRAVLPSWITFHVANILLLSSAALWHQSLRVIQDKAWSAFQMLCWFGLSTLTYSLIYEFFEPIDRAVTIRMLLGLLALTVSYALWKLSRQLQSVNILLISVSYLITGLSFGLHALMSSRGIDPSPFVKSWDANVLGIFLLFTALVSHLSFFGLTLDINVQRRLERRIERLREQETLQLNQKINDLERQTDLRMAASQLAHEINQPLTAVMAMSEVCIQALNKPHIPIDKVLSNLDKAAFNIKRASDLLVSIRMDSSPESANREPLNLHELTRTALELLDPQVQAHQIQINIHINQPKPAPLGNPLYMTQVLTNLMRNAIEAMSQSSTRVLTIATKTWGDALELSIDDTGPVISEENFNQLNQPFNSSKEHGLGIGLLICRSLLSRQGFVLEMHAKPSGGLQTTIRLPLPSKESPSC